jgi:hypothetical protein
LARGLPCERFTSALAGRRASLGVGVDGQSLPRGGLSPPILCQLSWRTPNRVKLRRTRCQQKSSGLPLKADLAQFSWHFAFVPESDPCTAARCILFDHPVGLGQQILRNGPAEFGSGAGIEHEFEFGRLLDR